MQIEIATVRDVFSEREMCRAYMRDEIDRKQKQHVLNYGINGL